jgi:hypothetical protein
MTTTTTTIRIEDLTPINTTPFTNRKYTHLYCYGVRKEGVEHKLNTKISGYCICGRRMFIYCDKCTTPHLLPLDIIAKHQTNVSSLSNLSLNDFKNKTIKKLDLTWMNKKQSTNLLIPTTTITSSSNKNIFINQQQQQQQQEKEEEEKLNLTTNLDEKNLNLFNLLQNNINNLEKQDKLSFTKLCPKYSMKEIYQNNFLLSSLISSGIPFIITDCLEHFNQFKSRFQASQRVEENNNDKDKFNLLSKCPSTAPKTISDLLSMDYLSKTEISSKFNIDNSGTVTLTAATELIKSLPNNNNLTFNITGQGEIATISMNKAIPWIKQNPTQSFYLKDIPVSRRLSYFLFGNIESVFTKEYYNDNSPVLPYEISYHDPLDITSGITSDYRNISLMSYLGGEGTSTPIHIDNSGSSAINIMISGMKNNLNETGYATWYLTSSADFITIENFLKEYYNQDKVLLTNTLTREDFKELSKLVTIYEIKQEVGMMIYVPSYSWHQVENFKYPTLKIAWDIMPISIIPQIFNQKPFDFNYRNNILEVAPVKSSLYYYFINVLKHYELISSKYINLKQDLIKSFIIMQEFIHDEIVTDEKYYDKIKFTLYTDNDTYHLQCNHCNQKIFNIHFTCSQCLEAKCLPCVLLNVKFNCEDMDTCNYKKLIPSQIINNISNTLQVISKKLSVRLSRITLNSNTLIDKCLININKLPVILQEEQVISNITTSKQKQPLISSIDIEEEEKDEEEEDEE